MRRTPLVFLLLVTTLPMMSVGARRARAEIAEAVIPAALSLDQALALFRQHGRACNSKKGFDAVLDRSLRSQLLQPDTRGFVESLVAAESFECFRRQQRAA